MSDAVTTLIDSPLTPYSSADDVRAWIKDLGFMDNTPEVQQEMKRAKQLLADMDKAN